MLLLWLWDWTLFWNDLASFEIVPVSFVWLVGWSHDGAALLLLYLVAGLIDFELILKEKKTCRRRWCSQSGKRGWPMWPLSGSRSMGCASRSPATKTKSYLGALACESLSTPLAMLNFEWWLRCIGELFLHDPLSSNWILNYMYVSIRNVEDGDKYKFYVFSIDTSSCSLKRWKTPCWYCSYALASMFQTLYTREANSDRDMRILMVLTVEHFEM